MLSVDVYWQTYKPLDNFECMHFLMLLPFFIILCSITLLKFRVNSAKGHMSSFLFILFQNHVQQILSRKPSFVIVEGNSDRSLLRRDAQYSILNVVKLPILECDYTASFRRQF